MQVRSDPPNDGPYDLWGIEILYKWASEHQQGWEDYRQRLWTFIRELMVDPHSKFPECHAIPGDTSVWAWVPETDIAVEWEVLQRIRTVALFSIEAAGDLKWDENGGDDDMGQGDLLDDE